MHSACEFSFCSYGFDVVIAENRRHSLMSSRSDLPHVIKYILIDQNFQEPLQERLEISLSLCNSGYPSSVCILFESVVADAFFMLSCLRHIVGECHKMNMNVKKEKRKTLNSLLICQ